MSMTVDRTQLEYLLENGYVRGVRHRELPLTVYNYTSIVQFEKVFGDYPLLLQCRGLVLDDDFNIVGRGFPKFFNYEEHSASELPLGTSNIEVTEKMDGSLLIVFRYGNQVVYTTRGSFYSDQSVSAGELFRELYSENMIEHGKSYLFEYIGPENRIVVTYDKADLVHLALLDTESGENLPRDSRFAQVPSHNVEGCVFGDELYQMLKALNHSNKEGFVVRYVDTNWRCKIKFEDYIRLHRIVTGVSNRSIWDCLAHGQDIREYIENVPDEFYQWVLKVKTDLESQYKTHEADCLAAFETVRNLPTRKDQALHLQAHYKEVMNVVFKMLDGGDYSEGIWKKLRPEKYVQPFSSREEG